MTEIINRVMIVEDKEYKPFGAELVGIWMGDYSDAEFSHNMAFIIGMPILGIMEAKEFCHFASGKNSCPGNMPIGLLIMDKFLPDFVSASINSPLPDNIPVGFLTTYQDRFQYMSDAHNTSAVGKVVDTDEIKEFMEKWMGDDVEIKSLDDRLTVEDVNFWTRATVLDKSVGIAEVWNESKKCIEFTSNKLVVIQDNDRVYFLINYPSRPNCMSCNRHVSELQSFDDGKVLFKSYLTPSDLNGMVLEQEGVVNWYKGREVISAYWVCLDCLEQHINLRNGLPQK